MITAFKAVGLALVIGGLLLWAVSVLPPFHASPMVVSPTEQVIANPLPVADDGFTTLSGIVIYDTQVTPNVPYVLYRLPDGGPRTKQLIFRNDRGCSPSAGDIPCAGGDVASFPDLPDGVRIRVTGVINGDQILVESLESA
ncbi:MAG: hypothetical protein QOE22_17 [Candidatus Parcubacteria bacterium]|jgi:hypothetical protein|nr:hypothetical protein [Candidatus Parcubacteria bacterium]